MKNCRRYLDKIKQKSTRDNASKDIQGPLKKGDFLSGIPVPQKHINGLEQTKKLIDHCIQVGFEFETDFLCTQLICMMDETNRDRGKREDMSKYVKMVTDVKRYLNSASERLTKLTLEREGLPVKNFAQEIVNFY